VGAKVAVVGGGSTYTPELVDGLCDHEDRMVVDELVLLDPDAARLEAVGGLSERILRRRGWEGRFRATADRAEAIDGADFVVIQLRIGGQAARLSDETLPLRHGCLGQETTGPGGLAKALRTVPVVLELAEETARRGAPGAWVVDFTNPVGIVTQALLDEGHRAVGLCNVARWVQRRVGHYLGGVAPDAVELEHVGLNHLSWVRSARVEGVDRLPDLLERFGPEFELECGSPLSLIRLLGALPSYYLHYYYERDAEFAVQTAPGYRPRAEVVAELEAKLLAEYRDPALCEKPAGLALRGGAYYSESAVRLMASLYAGTGDVQVVDVRNAGSLPGLSDDAVVEVPCVVDRHGAHPLPQRALPAEMFGLVEHAKGYERLAAQSAMTGSRDTVIRALVANPLVGQFPQAAELAESLLEANRAFLPRFFGAER
jgi:6-phospho-beta-glucosidase